MKSLTPSASALAVLRIGASCFVLCGGAGILAADDAPLKRVQVIELKGPASRLDHLAIDAAGRRLFVANMANSSLDVVDLAQGKLVRQIPGQRGIQGIAFARPLDRIFVGNAIGGVFNVFDGRNYELLKTIKFADDADNVRYDPETKLVYVAHAEKSLAVVDAESLKVRAEIELPGQLESFQLEKSRPRLYVNIPGVPEVAVVDTQKRVVVGHYPLKDAAANYPLAVDEANHRLLVGCRRLPALVVLDSESGKEVARVKIPADTDDLFYDARHKRIYASCGEGRLAVIRQRDADHYRLETNIPTAKMARTCFFDPRTGRLYLVVPRDADRQGPEVWVYQASAGARTR